MMTSWKPYLALLTVYLVWGTTAGFIRLGVDTMPSALLPCLRYLLAGTLLVLFCRLKGERLPGLPDLKINLIVGLLLFFAGNSIICWTVKYLTTGFGGIFNATTPLWMALLAAVLPPREKIPGLSLLGILIGFVGMTILLSPQLTHLSHTSPTFWLCIGGLLIMTFCWSYGSVYAKKHPTSSSLLMNVGLQNLFAGLAMVPVCGATIPEWTGIHPSGLSWFSLAYLVFLGTILATPCYLYVVKTMPVSVSSTFAYVTPVITLLFGRLFLSEVVTPTMILGTVVILAGVILVQYINRQWAISAKPVSLHAPKNPVLQEASVQ